MNEQGESVTEDAHAYYSIRLLVRNTRMPVDDISSAFEMTPTRAWNAGEKDFTEFSMWARTSWTEGKRTFFDEVHQVLKWLEEKHEFVSRLLSSGGELHVIVQLPGTINIGAELMPETALLAAKLGVRLGIEVFPKLPRPKNSASLEYGSEPL